MMRACPLCIYRVFINFVVWYGFLDSIRDRYRCAVVTFSNSLIEVTVRMRIHVAIAFIYPSAPTGAPRHNQFLFDVCVYI
jgi:hypothetical protein